MGFSGTHCVFVLCVSCVSLEREAVKEQREAVKEQREAVKEQAVRRGHWRVLCVRCMCLVCVLCVPCMCLVCVLCVPCMCLVCVLCVPCMCLVCVLCVPCMCLVCVLCVSCACLERRQRDRQAGVATNVHRYTPVLLGACSHLSHLGQDRNP